MRLKDKVWVSVCTLVRPKKLILNVRSQTVSCSSSYIKLQCISKTAKAVVVICTCVCPKKYILNVVVICTCVCPNDYILTYICL